MPYTTVEKQAVLRDYQRAPGDTGSPEVQVALITARINHLSPHFALHKRITIPVKACCVWSINAASCWNISKARTLTATAA